MTSPQPVNQTEPAVSNRERSKVRSFICLLWFLGFRAVGNLSLAWGVKHLGSALGGNPLTYLRAMLSLPVALGIVLLIGGLLARMALLSLADLSFVVPMTAIGYVISTLSGNLFLHETVTGRHWLGVFLIIAATVVVGSGNGRAEAQT